MVEMNRSGGNRNRKKEPVVCSRETMVAAICLIGELLEPALNTKGRMHAWLGAGPLQHLQQGGAGSCTCGNQGRQQERHRGAGRSSAGRAAGDREQRCWRREQRRQQRRQQRRSRAGDRCRAAQEEKGRGLGPPAA